jgi:hypothetical protein
MLEVIKAIARPAISILFAAALVVVVLMGKPVPEWFLGLAIPIISWWFVERAVTHVQENKTATVDKIAEKLSEKVVEKIYNKTNGQPT